MDFIKNEGIIKTNLIKEKNVIRKKAPIIRRVIEYFEW